MPPELVLILAVAAVITGVTGWTFIQEYKSREREDSAPLPVYSLGTTLPRETAPQNVLWRVPWPRNDRFVGRERELRALRKALREKGRALICPGKESKTGGRGKTQLALEYAFKYRKEYGGGVLWVRRGQHPLFEYGGLSDILDISLPAGMACAKRSEYVKKFLETAEEDTLVIFDDMDMDCYQSLRHLLPRTETCHLIFAAAEEKAWEGETITPGLLEDGEAIELLSAESGRDHEDVETVQSLCRLMGNLPLALKGAGRYLNLHPEVSLQEYRQKLLESKKVKATYKQDGTTELNPDPLLALEAVLAANDSLTHNPLTKKLLSLLSCFAPHNLNPEVLALLCGINKENERDFSAQIQRLAKLGILHLQTDNRCSIHPLWQQALQDTLPFDSLKGARRLYAVGIQNWFDMHNTADMAEENSAEIPHVISAARIALQEEIWPHTYDLCLGLARFFNYAGFYDEGLEWARQGMQEVLKNGPRELQKLAALNCELGLLENGRGGYEKAVVYFEESLKHDRELYGESHPQVASDLSNLGAAFDGMNLYKRAVAHYEKALAIDREYFGENYPNLAPRYNNLGGALYSMGEYEPAREYFEKALQVWKKSHGENHFQVAAALNNLGLAWKSLGEYEKAIEQYEKALAIDRKHYGRRHPKIAIDLNNLGKAWSALGETGKARECAQSAYSINLEFFGNESPQTEALRRPSDQSGV